MLIGCIWERGPVLGTCNVDHVYICVLVMRNLLVERSLMSSISLTLEKDPFRSLSSGEAS